MVLTRVVLIHLFLQTNTSIQLRHQVPTPIPFTCLVSINGNIKVTKMGNIVTCSMHVFEFNPNHSEDTKQ